MRTLLKVIYLCTVVSCACWPAGIAGQKAKDGRPGVELVLSGGGAKGFAHIGVLKVLEEAGLTFGYKSLIGPVEVTWMSSNLNRDLLFYFHIGYWF